MTGHYHVGDRVLVNEDCANLNERNAEIVAVRESYTLRFDDGLKSTGWGRNDFTATLVHGEHVTCPACGSDIWIPMKEEVTSEG